MSVCGSTVTSVSTVDDGPSQLEICTDARRRLGLDDFKVTADATPDARSTEPHLLVCSKVLLEKYAIPLCERGYSVEADVFLRNIKEYYAADSTPYTSYNMYDFKCMAKNVSADCRTVAVDLDCLVCKGGGGADLPTAGRHFYTAVAVRKVVEALAELYGDVGSIVEEVYMTRGSTCGMHLFFNRLCYTDEIDGVAVAREINKRLYESNLHKKVAADDGCRMWPCPGANHSGSTRTRVYKLLFQGSGERSERVSLKLNTATEKDLENLFVLRRTGKRPPPPTDASRPPKRARSVVEKKNDVSSASTTAVDAVSTVESSGTLCRAAEERMDTYERVSAATEDAVSVVESSGTLATTCRVTEEVASVVESNGTLTTARRRGDEARRSMPPPALPPRMPPPPPPETDTEVDREFPDKRYKNDLIREEIREAELSSASLQWARGMERLCTRQIYLENGSSVLKKRRYKLLFKLENVNRAIYKDDPVTNREWRDLKINYFNYYLINPVLLKILQSAVTRERVETAFGSDEYRRLCDAVGKVLEPFMKKETPDCVGGGGAPRRREREPHSVLENDVDYDAAKDVIVSSLVRVSTTRFDMITAVLSDFKKVQEKKFKYELKKFNRTAGEDVDAGEDDGTVRWKTTSEHRADVAGGGHRLGVRDDDDDDDSLFDCSASNAGAPTGRRDHDTGRRADKNRLYNNYAMLASLILHEENNLEELSLHALLYYYHSFPSNSLERLLNEITHEGLMVTAIVRFHLTHDSYNKITLKGIFDAFSDVMTTLCGGVRWSAKTKEKPVKETGGGGGGGRRTRDNETEGDRQRKKHSPATIKRNRESTAYDSDESGPPADHTAVRDERGERKKHLPLYKWNVRHLYEAMIDFYFRPTSVFEDKLVFAFESYDVSEDDAIDSCHTHTKLPKSDLQAAFKGYRKKWEMAHGSQLFYNSDLESPNLKCTFHVNVALKVYETLVGGCITRMKRVNRKYVHDDSRFNTTLYDVVAECMTASVRLTAAIDRSYVNLLLRQPVVPPFLEDEPAVRRMFMSGEELSRGSFCCLSIMDYVRIMNLYEKSTDPAGTCSYVESFLNTLVDDASVCATPPPNAVAAHNFRTLYLFYCTYLFEVAFALRHAYVHKERRNVTVDRVCYEFDVKELLELFFGPDEMKRVVGLSSETSSTLETFDNEKDAPALVNGGGGGGGGDDAGDMYGKFDVRPVPSSEVPDKVRRMNILFGRHGFEVMNIPTTTAAAAAATTGDTDETNSGCGAGEEDRRTPAYEESSEFENAFYDNERWVETISDRTRTPGVTSVATGRGTGERTTGRAPEAASGSLFFPETVAAHMKLELRKHVVHDRLGKLNEHVKSSPPADLTALLRSLSMRLKMLALVLATHSVKRLTTRLAYDYVEFSYKAERYPVAPDTADGPDVTDVWYRSSDALLSDRKSMLEHCRWLATERFPDNFFVGFNDLHVNGHTRVYDTLYGYMTKNRDRYPTFDAHRDDPETRTAKTVERLCVAVMFLLVMSAYDHEQVKLYLKMFLAVEWPGQWAKTIFVWKSNSNAGKSYLFDSIIKKACGQSTCINDPKGGKENAPEKAEYVKNFVLFAHEFSQAHSNELKKIVSESTIKFRLNYGNTMNEAYTTGKVMFNCNALPPTTDEAAINRLTLFNVPFWFCPRERVTDSMLNWVKTLNSDERPSRWERAYRKGLPRLLGEEEQRYFRENPDTKNELDLFDENVAATYKTNKSFSSMFLSQNKASGLYVALAPPTDDIVPGIVNVTRYFSWLRYFNTLETPVDFTMLPPASEEVRREWLCMTLPYQEWKQTTGTRSDPSGRVPAAKIHKSLKEFATKKNVNFEDMKQFFESDFAASKADGARNVYCVSLND